MPIDRTFQFKARANLIGKKSNGDSSLSTQEDQPTTSACYRQYSTQIGQLAKDMSDFFSVVLRKREDYLSFNTPFSIITEDDRNKFDRDSEKALSQLNDLVSTLGTRILKDPVLKKGCEKAHLSQAVAITQQQLTMIGNMITNMRKLRLRHVTDRQHFGSLASLTQRFREKEKVRSGSTTPLEGIAIRKRKVETKTIKSELSDGWDWVERSADIPERQVYNHDVEGKFFTSEIDDGLSDQERAQLTKENDKLYEKCAQVNADMDQLETQIAEIRRLQETFSEKLLDQERDIEVVHDTAVHTTENLKDGNEWIRYAISNSASRRVAVLFCIIVITFALLFIDWYKP